MIGNPGWDNSNDMHEKRSPGNEGLPAFVSKLPLGITPAILFIVMIPEGLDNNISDQPKGKDHAENKSRHAVHMYP